MNRKPNQPVPALNDIDRPPLEIDDEQKKFILTFGSFAKQAKREGRYDDLFNHATSRWWMKWPLDHAPTPLAITRSRLDMTRLLDWATNVTARIEPRMHWEAVLSGSRGTYIGYSLLIVREAEKLPKEDPIVPLHIGPGPRWSASSSNEENRSKDGRNSSAKGDDDDGDDNDEGADDDADGEDEEDGDDQENTTDEDQDEDVEGDEEDEDAEGEDDESMTEVVSREGSLMGIQPGDAPDCPIDMTLIESTDSDTDGSVSDIEVEGPFPVKKSPTPLYLDLD